MFVNASYIYAAFLRKNYFNKYSFKFCCFIIYQITANFIRIFVLLYNEVPPGVASGGICSIESFSRLILLLDDCVFEILDSVIPMKSNASFISWKNHSKIWGCFCKEWIFKCNSDRQLDFILLLRVKKHLNFYILNMANHYSHIFHLLWSFLIGRKGFLHLYYYFTYCQYLIYWNLLKFYKMVKLL